MAVPYNVIPIETHLAMIAAEQANVPVLVDAAKMWTEVRTWIESARVELHTRAHNLAPHWRDEAGRELEEKFQRSDAELKMWGERIDGAQVVETLTTLATAIPQAFQTVTGLYQAYLAAISNPFTAAAAPGFQQASGTQLTALGAQFDMSMLKVCAAAGIKSPGDVLPEVEETGTPAETMEAATATMGALSSLQGLASAAGAGSNLPMPEIPDLPTTDGPSLAGVTSTLPPPVTGAGFHPTGLPGGGGLPALSGPPVPMALPGTPGSTGGAGLPPARPAPSKQAATRATATGAAMIPPMVPPPHATGGTPRPTSAPEHRAGNSRTTRRAVNGTDGVPSALRGRSAKPATSSFTFPRHPEPLDEDLWQTPATR
ncbi:hypothetical protein ACQPZF_05900 [Actinosynnema sp. CS-041913]|uniref:hypothetical protein n=1 Tax=Actinosynnema sp. CS-041913 TaxID=3239917 RepID=UPI003D91791B